MADVPAVVLEERLGEKMAALVIVANGLWAVALNGALLGDERRRVLEKALCLVRVQTTGVIRRQGVDR